VGERGSVIGPSVLTGPLRHGCPLSGGRRPRQRPCLRGPQGVQGDPLQGTPRGQHLRPGPRTVVTCLTQQLASFTKDLFVSGASRQSTIELGSWEYILFVEFPNFFSHVAINTRQSRLSDLGN